MNTLLTRRQLRLLAQGYNPWEIPARVKVFPPLRTRLKRFRRRPRR